MPKAHKKAGSSRQRVARKGSGKKTASKRAANKRTGTSHRSPRKSKGRKLMGDATYVFECTRQGCGYRIVREEKAELGEFRADLKCPKCHNREFKCLGKGDLPETESSEFTLSTPSIEIDNINPAELKLS